MKVAVIGSGPAGYSAAIRASQLGAETYLIEKDLLGGACLNWACVPTKFMLNEIKPGTWKETIEKKDSFISQRRAGLEQLLISKDVKIIYGSAQIINNNLVTVNEERIECDRIIIATGSKPKKLKFAERAVNARKLLSQTEISDKAVIIGGGAVGLEFATMLNSSGCHVSVCEMMPHVLPREDEETALNLERAMKRSGIDIYTGCSIQEITDTSAKFIYKNKDYEIEAPLVISGVGAAPRFDKEELDKLGISYSDQGIKVDDYCETSVKGIYAIGDATGGMMLAYTGKAQALAASENAVCGNSKKINFKAVPRCIFSHPTFAACGLTEQECNEEVIIGKYPMAVSPVASMKNEKTGFIKVIASKESHRLLGCHILGLNAELLISDAALAIQNEMTLEQIEDVLYVHPTLSEGFWEACSNALKRSIDI